MDVPKKLMVGYDLCDDYTQISCFSYKTSEPVAICTGDQEEEDCKIPTVLCLRKDTKQWLFGEEAIQCANNGEGILLDHLLTKVKSDAAIELYQNQFTGVVLLEKYFRKTLTLLKNHFPTDPITKIVLTVDRTEPILVNKIYEALSLLGIERDRAVVLSHADAYLYYALSQEKSLWMNDVGLFDFNENGLLYCQIRVNRRTKPILARITTKNPLQDSDPKLIFQKGGNVAYILENAAETVLYKQLISTLYFTGKGFEGGWADQIIKKLCIGRRGFLGQNLYTRGACYAAKELSGDQTLGELLLLREDMVTTALALRVYCDTKYKEIPLLEAGDIWYEVDTSLEVIPDKEAELEIVRKHIMTKEVLHERIRIEGLPERPNRMTRLWVNFTCDSKSTGILKIADLGFGEFYPATGTEMNISLEIS